MLTNFIKKNQKDTIVSTFVITNVAFLLSIGATLLSSRFIVLQRTDFYGVIRLSMSNIVLGFFLYFRALKHSPALLIASFTFFTPFVTLVFIMILLGERLTVTDYLAALLIIFSVPIQKVGHLIHKTTSGNLLLFLINAITILSPHSPCRRSIRSFEA